MASMPYTVEGIAIVHATFLASLSYNGHPFSSFPAKPFFFDAPYDMVAFGSIFDLHHRTFAPIQQLHQEQNTSLLLA